MTANQFKKYKPLCEVCHKNYAFMRIVGTQSDGKTLVSRRIGLAPCGECSEKKKQSEK